MASGKTAVDIQKRRKRLERIRSSLRCPSCLGRLEMSEKACTCLTCQATYPIRDSQIYFVEGAGVGDDLDDLKGHLRKFVGPIYRTIADIIAPDFPVFRKRETEAVFDTAVEIVVDCGSGSQRLDDHVVTLDFTDYPAVDIICDICARLPFADGSLDGAVSWGVIEHLERPDAFVSELARCIKPRGETVHMVPFMYPFHSSPHDFFRYSDQGVRLLLSEFEIIDVRNASGPVSYLLLGLVEFGSIILSFGNGKLKSHAYLVLCAMTFPLKIFDWPFVNRRAFITMAPCLVVNSRSRAGPREN